MSEIVRPFTISATDLNLTDTQEITLASFGLAPANTVRIPTRLELYWPATTAYTLGSTAANRHETLSNDGTQEFQSGGKWFVVRDAFYNILFRVKQEGFIDQTVAAAYRVALPVGGITLAPASSGFYLRSTSSISGGAGALTGRIYYIEHVVTGA